MQRANIFALERGLRNLLLKNLILCFNDLIKRKTSKFAYFNMRRFPFLCKLLRLVSNVYFSSDFKQGMKEKKSKKSSCFSQQSFQIRFLRFGESISHDIRNHFIVNEHLLCLSEKLYFIVISSHSS